MKYDIFTKFNFDNSRREFRSQYVDITKGVAIISVVLLHTNFQFPSSHYMPLSSLLGWMWHVAVFFLIGGFFINESKLIQPFFFIKGKLGSLYKLLLYFYIPVVLLHNFFIRIGCYKLSVLRDVNLYWVQCGLYMYCFWHWQVFP